MPPDSAAECWWSAAERSLLRQRRKIRHLALGHELLQQLRVHAVDAQNDELLIAVPGVCVTRERGRCEAQYKRQPEFPDEVPSRLRLILASPSVDVKQANANSR